MKIKTLILAAASLLSAANIAAQNVLTSAEREQVSAVLSRILSREISGTSTSVKSSRLHGNTLTLGTSITFSYYPFREDNLRAIYDSVRNVLPAKYRKSSIVIVSDGHSVDEFIPLAFRTAKSGKDKYRRFVNPSPVPLVTPLSHPHTPDRGLLGRHIALWQSHGRYFDNKENVWKWQRTRIWQTCEDLFTQSFVLPYLVPMLENAGATVLLPRERDYNTDEIIIDNDGGGYYAETDGQFRWHDGGTGFAHKRDTYLDGENPFREGTFRAVSTVTGSSAESKAVWGADIPERGEYAVYVSYRTVKNGCNDAVYTVHHAGGQSSYRVNQTMGGGTWIYLGHFMFDKGTSSEIVTLSNRSSKSGCTLTADAVKIGGGYGNIARSASDSLHFGRTNEPVTSGMPRYCEGARYWLQWAGLPYDVYSKFESQDDYKDDYTSRAHWVNALMGGSERLAGKEGLGIPVDMALAFHSDSGLTDDDSTIGTLGIFCTKDNRGRFNGGASRYISRELSDIVMTQITGDIRALYDPAWRRRGMWNRSYYEARVPNVPTMLLELLSHQNFADMRYGADPRFRFTVSRAIYKGILRHLSAQYGVPCCVAPLPVTRFAAELLDDGVTRLSWQATPDPLEPTAVPEKYILYTRIDDGGFDNGRIVDGTECLVQQQAGHIYSYRVTAVNAGGESFAGETLAACHLPDSKGRVLIINGFSRISAPVSTRSLAAEGFMTRQDSGSAYIKDAAFAGEQYVFDPSLRRENDDDKALGASYPDYEGIVVAGNTLDYPCLHGRSVADAGYSFCSSNASAVSEGRVATEGYDVIDYIAGKQRAVTMGSGDSGCDFKLFTPEMERVLAGFASRGGALFVSGCYLATDLWQSEYYDDNDRDFARNVLHYESADGITVQKGRAVGIRSKARIAGEYTFRTEPNEYRYSVESSDVLAPSGDGAFAAVRYAERNRVAGVAYDGPYRSIAIGFPFECIDSDEARNRLMSDILRFLVGK